MARHIPRLSLRHRIRVSHNLGEYDAKLRFRFVWERYCRMWYRLIGIFMDVWMAQLLFHSVTYILRKSGNSDRVFWQLLSKSACMIDPALSFLYVGGNDAYCTLPKFQSKMWQTFWWSLEKVIFWPCSGEQRNFSLDQNELYHMISTAILCW